MSEGPARNDGSDAEDVAEPLAAWLGDHLPGTGPVRLGPFEKPGSGLSGGTVLVEAVREDNDRETVHQLVVRFPATDGSGLFPDGDLARELDFQALLDRAGLPVAPLVGYDRTAGTLGKPFVVTRKVPGRVVASSDPYLSRGWLHDASEEHQRRLLAGFFDTLAQMHRIEPEHGSGNGLRDAVRRWASYLEWADCGTAPDELHDAADWCARNLPPESGHRSALWGDPQLANAVFADDGSIVALLDFELSHVGPAELDVGWFLCLHDMTVARCGQDLPGFGDRARFLARYEQILDRGLEPLEWYETFGAVCTASILVRVSVLLGPDFSWLARSNPALDYLRARLR
jgi:aminoglycoside phosphotransferase (APT) family kinase protein